MFFFVPAGAAGRLTQDGNSIPFKEMHTSKFPLLTDWTLYELLSWWLCTAGFFKLQPQNLPQASTIPTDRFPTTQSHLSKRYLF